jgi:flagellar assembly factor FliW
MTEIIAPATFAARFITPPLGLEPRTDFTVVPISPDQGLYALIHSDGVRVRVLDASHRIPEFAREDAEKYGRVVDAENTEEVSVFIVLASRADGITGNLDAPVIVNRRTGVAQQVIHPGELNRLRVPLVDILA